MGLGFPDIGDGVPRTASDTPSGETGHDIDPEANGIYPRVSLRYHDLVDRQLAGRITAAERAELERLEACLDEEEQNPELEARDRQWELERSELLRSIDELLSQLRK